MTPLLRDIWVLSSNVWILTAWDLESSEGSFTPMSGLWAEQTWRRTAKQITYPWPLRVAWLPHSIADFIWQLWALGLSLLVNKEKAASPFLLSLESHIVSFCCPDSRGGNQPPSLDGWNVTSGNGKQWCSCLWETQYIKHIIFFPPNGNSFRDYSL